MIGRTLLMIFRSNLKKNIHSMFHEPRSVRLWKKLDFKRWAVDGPHTCWQICISNGLFFPPYLPDLALPDFVLFPQLKGYLGKIWFQNDEELKEATEKWLQNQAHSSTRLELKNLYLDMKNVKICPVFEAVKFMETVGSIRVFHSVEKTGFVSF